MAGLRSAAALLALVVSGSCASSTSAPVPEGGVITGDGPTDVFGAGPDGWSVTPDAVVVDAAPAWDSQSLQLDALHTDVLHTDATHQDATFDGGTVTCYQTCYETCDHQCCTSYDKYMNCISWTACGTYNCNPYDCNPFACPAGTYCYDTCHQTCYEQCCASLDKWGGCATYTDCSPYPCNFYQCNPHLCE